jgi:hypothetical protein
MTTTSKFKINKLYSDYFLSIQECQESFNIQKKHGFHTNPRYKNYNQRHFTAGDIDQFDEYRDTTNGQMCMPIICLEKNIFNNINFNEMIMWEKYKDLQSTDVLNTFNYMFHKFKKGIFIKIQSNKLKVFLPFSKKNYLNEWANRINIGPQYEKYFNNIKQNIHSKGDYSTRLLLGLLWYQNHMSGITGKKYNFRADYIEKNIFKWYANDCIVRWDTDEGDTNVSVISDMFHTLCKDRTVPDIELFINRRDFPMIKKNGTEAYEHLFGKNTPLLSHNYQKYIPILSMVTRKEYADIPIPTGDDWKRISSNETPPKYFPQKKCGLVSQDFDTPWDQKKSTAVFRGSSTGCGVDTETNTRLKLAEISVLGLQDNDIPYLDAGITDFNARLRKIDKPTDNFQTLNIPELRKKNINKVEFLSTEKQAEYKYIVNVDGHVSAFRLSLELNTGSCILLVKSKYEMWFHNMLEPNIHYIPVKEDLSDLIDTIKWCRANDEKCSTIASNARIFYQKYLQKDGILDYLQQLIINIKKQTGIYLYNVVTPLQLQLEQELKSLTLYYPLDHPQNNIINVKNFPKLEQLECHSVLEGVNWVINTFINDFFKHAKFLKRIFQNKTGSLVDEYSIGEGLFVVKTTSNQKKVLENSHETFL